MLSSFFSNCEEQSLIYYSFASSIFTVVNKRCVFKFWKVWTIILFIGPIRITLHRHEDIILLFVHSIYTRLEMVNIAINLETPDFLLHWHCEKFDKNNLKTRVLLMIESFANNYELVNWYSNYMSLENYVEILYDSKMKYFLILYQIFYAWKKLLLQQSNYNHIKMGCIQLISFFL